MLQLSEPGVVMLVPEEPVSGQQKSGDHDGSTLTRYAIRTERRANIPRYVEQVPAGLFCELLIASTSWLWLVCGGYYMPSLTVTDTS